MEIERQKLHLLIVDSWPSGLDGFMSKHRSGQKKLSEYDGEMRMAIINFQQKQQLDVTGKADEITKERLSDIVQTSQLFVVAGAITDNRNKPVEGAVILVNDVDFRIEQELGNTKTNINGEYFIVYKAEKFSRDEKERADLEITATNTRTNETISSKIHFNAKEASIINLKFEQEVPTVNEYENYISILKPIRRNVPLHEFNSRDIDFCHGETRISKCHLKFLQLDAKWSTEKNLPESIFYAWMRKGSPPAKERLFQVDKIELKNKLEEAIDEKIVSEDKHDLVDKIFTEIEKFNLPDKSELSQIFDSAELTPKDIKDQNPALYKILLNKALLSLGQILDKHFQDSSQELVCFIGLLNLSGFINSKASLKEYLQHELSKHTFTQVELQLGFSKISKLQSPQIFDDILQPDVPLRKNLLFNSDIDNAQALLISNYIGFDEKITNGLLKNNIKLNDLTQSQLDELVKEKVFNKSQAKDLAVNTNLWQFAKGDFKLVDTIKNKFDGKTINSLRDLPIMFQSSEVWKDSLEAAQFNPPDGLTIIEYSEYLDKKVERLFPHDVFVNRFKLVEKKELQPDIEKFHELTKLKNHTAEQVEQLNQSIEKLKPKINLYPGLNLFGLFKDKSLSAQEKADEAERRIKLIRYFHENNKGALFLSIDYRPDSKEADELGLSISKEDENSEITNDDKRMLVRYHVATQELYRLTEDVNHVYSFLENGYTSILDISLDSVENIANNTGILPKQVQQIILRSEQSNIDSAKAYANVLEASNNAFQNSIVNNRSTSIDRYLRELTGFGEHFGNQDYCHCKHCQSIYSPAAYFVDLMDYINKYISEAVYTGEDIDRDRNLPIYYLALKTRRPDLWESLSLSCECTTTLVPYLTIILEVLENYLVRLPGSGFDGRLDNRVLVEKHVYRKLYDQAELYSFNQPFNLPLDEIDTYLEHFPITRAQIARVWFDSQTDTHIKRLIAAAELSISIKEADYIENITEVSERNQFLKKLYGFSVPVSDDVDIESKQLLRVMGISREQLTELADTRFVGGFLSGRGSLRFESRRRDGDEELQPDMEVVKNPEPHFLERMHRFIRLWKKQNLSIQELDKVQYYIYEAGLSDSYSSFNLVSFVDVYLFKNKFDISVDDLCALLHELPAHTESDLYYRLFVLPEFDEIVSNDDSEEPNPIEVEGNDWQKPSELEIDFTHPAFYQENFDTNEYISDVAIQQRLLKGLNINDEQLFELIELLSPEAGMDPLLKTQANSFKLNLQTLTVLFRHVRMAKALRVNLAELFALIRINSTELDNKEYLSKFTDIQSLVELHNWRKKSDYSIKELAFMLEDDYGKEDAEENKQQVNNIIEKIAVEQSTVFAETVFAYFDGITEEHSKKIIELNLETESDEDKPIAKLKINRYKIKSFPSLEDESEVTWPDSIGAELHTDLIVKFKAFIEESRTNGSPEFVDKSLAVTLEITNIQAEEILSLNTAIFERTTEQRLYFLTDKFEPEDTSNIIIPRNIPLQKEEAHQLLLNYSASEIVLNEISRDFNISTEKVKKLLLLTGLDLFSDQIYIDLLNVLNSVDNNSSLFEIVQSLKRMSILFKSEQFDSATIEFIKNNSGAESNIFYAPESEPNFSDNFKNLNLDIIKQICLFRQMIEINVSKKQDLLTVIRSPNYNHEYRKFKTESANESDSAFDLLEEIFDVNKELVRVLNELIEFPASDNNKVLFVFNKLKICIELAQYLGMGGQALPMLIGSYKEERDPDIEDDDSVVDAEFDDIFQSVQTILSAIRTKYESEENFNEVIRPFQDRIREQKRDGLTEYLMHNSDPSIPDNAFNTTNNLYHYFLIDTELEGCAQTSKVVAGISSCQLYIQRVILNLEQSPIGVEPEFHAQFDDIRGQKQWEWRKNYRVWEANRKVFLFPENYILPDLRDNKTELFTEFETELLQQEINEQNVIDAYTKYVKGFEEVANLKISGAYHDKNRNNDILHLFGVTSDQPPQHYYRTIENIYSSQKRDEFKIVWNPWKKLNLQIPVEKVSPIVYRNRLYVFWVQITTRPYNRTINGKSEFNGYDHLRSVYFSYQKLDLSWAPSQSINFSHSQSNTFSADGIKTRDILIDNQQINNFLTSDDGILISSNDEEGSRGNLQEFGSELITELITPIFWKLKSEVDSVIGDFNLGEVPTRLLDILLKDESLETSLHIGDQIIDGTPEHIIINLGGKIYLSLFFSYPEIRSIFIPEYDAQQRLHFEPLEDYTLEGFQWDRVYPNITHENKLALNVGNDLRTSLILDTYEKKSAEVLNLQYWFRNYTRNRALTTGSAARFGLGLTEARTVREYGYSTSIIRSVPTTEPFISSDLYPNLSIVNGSLTDCLLEYNNETNNGSNDIYYVHHNVTNSGSGKIYRLKRLGTTLSNKISRDIIENGITYFLDINYQNLELKETSLPIDIVEERVANDVPPMHVSAINHRGSMGINFREMYFHIPFLIANYLNSRGLYAESQRWYHYIFDPTSNNMPDNLDDIDDSVERRRRMADRVWQYLEFRDQSVETLRRMLGDEEAIDSNENDPFNPHAIARNRFGAYMKCIFMKYCDNLLDWGDQLFAQDTMESINEATLLYIMAQDLLGAKPEDIGECQENVDRTYNTLYSGRNPGEYVGGLTYPPPYKIGAPDVSESGLIAHLNLSDENDAEDPFSGIFVPLVTIESSEHNETESSHATSFLKQAEAFCIPLNPDLLAYWDRVADRLYKIRNCLNIRGIKRQLPLFSPEIDPRLLVRAKAAGISIDDALDSISGNLPPYRFNYLMPKAKEYVGACQAFGGVLLSAFEKKDAEELSDLRLKHQINILKLTRRQRDMEVTAAEESLEALNRRKETIENKVTYFEDLVDEGLLGIEGTRDALYYAGHSARVPALAYTLVSMGAASFPSILGFSVSTVTKGLSSSTKIAADSVNVGSELTLMSSNMVGKQAGYERREQGWEFSLEQAKNELKELGKQLIVAEIRKDIAIKSRELHEKNIENSEEVYELFKDKFTNLGLYTWLCRELQQLYRQAYKSALTLCRMTEQAFRFERNDYTTQLLSGNHMDAERAGLLAGEHLMAELRNMELMFIETNSRSMEIDQAFSLMQIDPNALLKLKQTGECDFTIPEWCYDLFYPGQYRRCIKSARLTIPCITGPYTNVGATLTLTDSQIRKEAKIEAENLIAIPPSRSTTVATSTAQNDAGVFNLDFRDERYMPFEGAGAISSWKLELPKNFKVFDYSTINDCIMHVSYTAEYDGIYRGKVETENRLLDEVDPAILFRSFSLRQEFSQTFHALTISPLKTEIPFELSEKHFPLFLQGKALQITNANLILDIEQQVFNRFFSDVEGGESILQPKLTVSISIKDTTTDRVIDGFTSENKGDGATVKLELPTPSRAFNPVHDSIIYSISIETSGEFGFDDVELHDAIIDTNKLKDILFYFEYKLYKGPS